MPEVETLTRDGVTTLTLNRPTRLNAFTPAGYRELAAALREIDRDPRVRVAVLTGSGRAFSAGVDVGLLEESSPSVGAALRAGYAELLDTLIAGAKPLVAAVNGPAVGLGMTLLLHCDIVLAAESAPFAAPFVRLGLSPEGASSVLLARAVGAQRAAWLLLTGATIGASHAVEMGFVARTYPDSELQDEARSLARDLASESPAAVQATRRLLRASVRDSLGAVVGAELRAMQSLGHRGRGVQG